jgi:kynureninase
LPHTVGDSIALVLFSGVQFYTGQLFDLPGMTSLAKKHGCIVGFDLAHAVGNVPLYLHDWNIDFACWCMYKYMNCGPGSIAGCFVHENYGHPSLSYPPNSSYPLAEPFRFGGWWGNTIAKKFDMEKLYIPNDGADGYRLSNPPIISTQCVKASLDIFDKAGKLSVLILRFSNVLF